MMQVTAGEDIKMGEVGAWADAGRQAAEGEPTKGVERDNAAK